MRRALRALKSGKSLGLDERPSELFKAGGDECIKLLHNVCVSVWNSNQWPQDLTTTKSLALPKKTDATQCQNHRTVALISQASKILLKIIADRVKASRNSSWRTNNSALDQDGHKRPDTKSQTNHGEIKGTEQTAIPMLHYAFIDYRKAFDCVEHNKLWKWLVELGFLPHIVAIIRSLKENQKATVCTGLETRIGLR